MISDFVIQSAISSMERGLVPDVVMRKAMRALCGRRLAGMDSQQAEVQAFMQAAQAGPIAPLPDKANEQHYEVPSEFFGLVLGRHRKYSCCYWPEGTRDLNEAEQAALTVTCERAGIRPGMRILELGCGWGSLTLWMAEQFAGAHITAVSNSRSQKEFIDRQAAQRGLLDRVSVITADMNDYEPDARFDRVVSIEMFEHMRNHAELMRRVSTWLDDNGKLFVHVFCHRSHPYAFVDEGASSWMTRYFFSGGTMPSRELLLHYNQDMVAERVWEWNGLHYKKTQDAWLERLDQHRSEVLPILAATYGKHAANRWFHRWRMFFLACSELFGYDEGREWFVAHYLFSPAHSPVTV